MLMDGSVSCPLLKKATNTHTPPERVWSTSTRDVLRVLLSSYHKYVRRSFCESSCRNKKQEMLKMIDFITR